MAAGANRPRSRTLVGVGRPRVIVVPRWGGTPSDDWYPWLRAELGEDAVEVLDMPEPGRPTIPAWTEAVSTALGDDPYALAQTMLVGHSVGAQAAMRALAALAPGRSVARLVCVAGWFTVDAPWDDLRPWIETPIDDAAVAEGAQRIRVLLSTNDPYTSDAEANAHAWRERLEAEVVIVPEARHFNAAQEPVVLEQVRELFVQL
jgi:predicted alpha/beta hydrolase family esterase